MTGNTVIAWLPREGNGCVLPAVAVIVRCDHGDRVVTRYARGGWVAGWLGHRSPCHPATLVSPITRDPRRRYTRAHVICQSHRWWGACSS